MSTRCQIWFACDWKDEQGNTAFAKVYQHSDGYPDTATGVIAELRKLYALVSLSPAAVKELKKQPHPLAAYGDSYKEKTLADYVPMYGTRVDDAEWCAAEFITMFRKPMSGNYYVAAGGMHGDEDYKYIVRVGKSWTVEMYVHDMDVKEPEDAYTKLEKTFTIGARARRKLSA